MNRISFVLPVTLQEEGSGLNTWREAPEEGFSLRIALLPESFLSMLNPSPETSAIDSSRNLKSVRKSR